jgi:hypothetical protein
MPVVRYRAVGVVVSAGRLATSNDTGIDNGLFAAPGALTRTELVYVPATRPAGFTATWRVAGVGPPPDTDSQETGGDMLADVITTSLLVMRIGRSSGGAPPGA